MGPSGVREDALQRVPRGLRGDVLVFGPLALTRRACPDRVDGLEDRFVTLLRRVTRAERRGETLILLAVAQDRLVFTAAVVPDPEADVNPGGG